MGPLTQARGSAKAAILPRLKSANVAEWGGVETEGSLPELAGNRVGDGAARYTQTVTVRSCGEGFQPPAAGLAALYEGGGPEADTQIS